MFKLLALTKATEYILEQDFEESDQIFDSKYSVNYWAFKKIVCVCMCVCLTVYYNTGYFTNNNLYKPIDF